MRRAGRFAAAPYVSVHALEAGEAMQCLIGVRSARTALRLEDRAGRLVESPYPPAVIRC